MGKKGDIHNHPKVNTNGFDKNPNNIRKGLDEVNNFKKELRQQVLNEQVDIGKCIGRIVKMINGKNDRIALDAIKFLHEVLETSGKAKGGSVTVEKGVFVINGKEFEF